VKAEYFAKSAVAAAAKAATEAAAALITARTRPDSDPLKAAALRVAQV
jgi:hypothetical protein